MSTLSRFILSLLLTSSISIAHADITVLAAGSLTNALSDIAKAYQTKTGTQIKTSFASSSVLAKQIENGIAADIFISADTQWLDYVASKMTITNRRNLLANNLVLIAPKGKGFNIQLTNGVNLAGAFEGKLCTGETETVPVGKYAKQALEKLQLWDSIKTRLVGTEDVRSALAFVEQGECAAGIVYTTDAQNSNKVDTIAIFPSDSHAPIIYPIALISQNEQAKDFLNYLTEAEPIAVFKKYGFKAL
jgi:molybdate transport system substrate-binding protein